MATKKNTSSSKTARVLNMIAGDKKGKETDAAPAVQEGAAEQPQAADKTDPVQEAPAARPHLTPPILEEVKADDLLAQKIKTALEEEVQAQEQLAAQEVAVETPAEPEQGFGEERQAAGVQIEDVRSELETGAAPEEAPPDVRQGASAPDAEGEKPNQEEEGEAAWQAEESESRDFSLERETGGRAYVSGDLTYVNVMQSLVEEKAKKYMKMFGVCACSRCTADVIALALTNLPPKYIVMPRGEVVPMLTVYENRYSAAIIAQVMRACKTVMASPRHKL